VSCILPLLARLIRMPRLLPLFVLAACLSACAADTPNAPSPDTGPRDSTSPSATPPAVPATPSADTLTVAEAVRPGSCDKRPAEPLCYAFTGAAWTVEGAQNECLGAIGGTYGTAACPTSNRIGECVYRPGGDAEREVVYTFYAPQDPLIAEGICPGTYRAF